MKSASMASFKSAAELPDRDHDEPRRPSTICFHTRKPVDECNCEPSRHGLRCGTIVSPNYEGSPDVVCHNPADRYCGGKVKDDGICSSCLEEAAQGGDFPTDKLDDYYPPATRYGILTYDRGDVRWCSLGAMPKLDAEERFRTWDRVSGADAHRVYALGVLPYERLDDGNTDHVLRATQLVEQCLVRFEGVERAMRDYACTLEAIRETLGQKETHYMVMAGDVADVVEALALYSVDACSMGPSLAQETLRKLRSR
jgi:hypothetical protein